MATTPDTSITGAPGESPVERAFRLLQVVVAAGESLGIRELSRRSGLPRSTVSRLIGILTDLGMVDRTADGSVIPGSALATLQPGELGDSLLPDRIRPLLAELVQLFGENAALSIDDGDSLLYLRQVTAEQPVSVPDVTGARHNFHMVAPGLLTMAWWTTDRLADHLAGPLERETSTTVVDPDELRARCAQIRTDQWCWTDQEFEVGVNGLAVPVLDGEKLLATISLFGPTYRFSPTVRPNLAGELAEIVASRVPTLLGTS